MIEPIQLAEPRLLNHWFCRGSHALDDIIGPSGCLPFRRPWWRFANYARDAFREFRNLSLEFDIQLGSSETLSIKKIWFKIIELTCSWRMSENSSHRSPLPQRVNLRCFPLGRSLVAPRGGE
jgi:hypothetical protein